MRLHLSVSAILLALLSFHSAAWGYTLMTDPPSRWRLDFEAGDEVPWVLNSDGCPDMDIDQTQSILEASFQAWEDVDCATIGFDFDEITDQIVTTSDDTNLMVWRTSLSDWPYGFGALGVTGAWFSMSGIVDADIEFNSVNYEWSDNGQGGSIDLQSVATHEIGHLLGLDHTDAIGAVMFPTYSGGTSQRVLTSDDISGVCFLYPAAGGGCTTEGDCPPGHECTAGDCVPIGGGEVCAPCSGDGQCGGPEDRCIPYPVGSSRCGFHCGDDPDCDGAPGCDGRTCLCLDGQCVPDGHECGVVDECDDDRPCPNDLECVDGQCVPRGCEELGEGCEELGDCCSGMCLDGQCSQACDWLRPGESCPSGFYCEIQECGVGACKPGALGGSGRGETCEAHDECQTGYCASTGGPPTCQIACDPDSLNTCADEWQCYRIGASYCGLCACQIGALGDPCEERGNCASGLCATKSGNRRCSRICNTTSNPCPDGYDCLDADPYDICWPEEGGLGAECADDDDCTDGECVGSVCARPCDTDCDCPLDHICGEIDGEQVCRRGSSSDEDRNLRGCDGCAVFTTSSPIESLGIFAVLSLFSLVWALRRH